MYQFTTTNIINSALDSNGVTAKYAGSTTALTVARVGTFAKDNIVSVTKRAYYAGVLEVAEVTVPTITAGLSARLEIKVQLSQSTYSEYANAYLFFEKPVYVEIIATGTAATDAAAFVTAISKLTDRFGNPYISAEAVGAVITVTALDVHQRFESIKVLEEDPTAYTNTLIDPQYTDVTAGTFSVTTDGLVGFGDDDWMMQRIRVQTLDNYRPFGLSIDERPIMGGNYSQYTLKYSVDKDHDEGIVSGLKSVTTHVFYVLDSLTAGFETALNDDLGLDLDGAGKYTVIA